MGLSEPLLRTKVVWDILLAKDGSASHTVTIHISDIDRRSALQNGVSLKLPDSKRSSCYEDVAIIDGIELKQVAQRFGLIHRIDLSFMSDIQSVLKIKKREFDIIFCFRETKLSKCLNGSWLFDFDYTSRFHSADTTINIVLPKVGGFFNKLIYSLLAVRKGLRGLYGLTYVLQARHSVDQWNGKICYKCEEVGPIQFKYEVITPSKAVVMAVSIILFSFIGFLLKLLWDYIL